MVTVRLATPPDMPAVHRLCHDCYVATGELAPRPDGQCQLYPHLDESPDTKVWVAERQADVVGSISATLDGPAGLHTDIDFPLETETIRCEPRDGVLACSWRILVTPQYRSGASVVKALVERVQLWCREKNVTTCLMIFPLRQVRTYEKWLGFTFVKQHESLLGMRTGPVVLMRGDA